MATITQLVMMQQSTDWQAFLQDKAGQDFHSSGYEQPAPPQNPEQEVEVAVVDMQDSLLSEMGMNYWALYYGHMYQNGEVTAAQTDMRADALAGHDITTHQVDHAGFTSGADSQTLAQNADVISRVYVNSPTAIDGKYYTTAPEDAHHSTDEGIARSEAVWEGSDAILVRPTTEQAHLGELDMMRTTPDHNIYNDTSLRVGRTTIDPESGEQVIAAGSAAGQISLVAADRVPGDIDHKQHVAPEEAHDAVMEYLQANRESFIQQLQQADPTAPQQVFTVGFDGQQDITQLEGGEILGKTPEDLLNEHPPEEIFDAYATAMADFVGQRYDTNDHDPDEALPMVGATAAASEVTAQVAAAKSEYAGVLSSHDIVAAAYTAAEPVRQAQSADGEGLVEVSYADNGRGLEYSDGKGGFGALDAESYQQHLAEMAALKQANPELETVEKDITSGKHEFDNAGQSTAAPREYTITMDENATVMRNVVELDFGDNTDVPREIEITSPDGASMTVSPSFTAGGSQYVMAGTDAFFGTHAEGEWTIRVPEGYELESAQIKVEGVEPGGLIDAHLDRQVGPREDAALDGQKQIPSPREYFNERAENVTQLRGTPAPAEQDTGHTPAPDGPAADSGVKTRDPAADAMAP